MILITITIKTEGLGIYVIIGQRPTSLHTSIHANEANNKNINNHGKVSLKGVWIDDTEFLISNMVIILYNFL
jgi:hypothetical protein